MLDILESLLGDSISLEAIMNTDPEDGSEPIPMQIQLYTDKIIEKAKLQAVTNPIPFLGGTTPTEDGIFSNTIFGETSDTRRRQYAYIDLHQKFFHPYVYEVIKALNRKIEKVASGRGYWHIDNTGELVEVAQGDPNYDEMNTGLGWLVDNFRKIKFKETDSVVRKDRLRFLQNLSDDEIFISKWIVIPVFYRGYTEKNGKLAVSDIDKIYNKLISYSNGLNDSPFALYNNQLLFNIQLELIKLRKMGGDLIRGKHGLLHKAILGKSIDRGSRDVISQMVLNNCERPEDNPVDIFHTGMPLAKCLVVGYDFILKYCLDFFQNTFKNKRTFDIYKMTDGEWKYSHSIPIKDQLLIYTKNYLDKIFTQYKNTPSMRFDIIYVYGEQEGVKIPLTMVGQFNTLNTNDIKANTVSRRPMTWTDLIYIAAMETVADKYMYTTRFPVTSYLSIFPTKCTPLTTLKTIPAYVNGKFYRNYPYVELDLPKEKLVTKFIDTLCISDLFLDVIGGDWTERKSYPYVMIAYKSNLVQENFGERLTSGVYYNQLIG